MIRKATKADLARCVEMSGRFILETGYRGKIADNPAARREIIAKLIDGPDGVVYVIDDDGLLGMIGAFVFTHPMSGERIGCESFWWVEPEKRGTMRGVSLLKKAEAWADEKGADRMIMVQPAGAPRVGRIYEMLGYDHLENQYQKDL